MSDRGGLRVARVALSAAFLWTAFSGGQVTTAQTVQMPLMPQLPQLPSVPNLPTLQVGAPATPVITSPKNGAAVKPPIVVQGTAAHGVKITVTATLTTSIQVSGMSTQVGQAAATADDKGAWQVSITPKIPVTISSSALKIVLEAVASNPTTGQKSPAAKVEVVPHS